MKQPNGRPRKEKKYQKPRVKAHGKISEVASAFKP